MADVKMIGVIGGGQMGSGIAQLTAMHGIDVCLLDVNPQVLSTASSSISSSINRLVSKSQLSQSTASDALKRLRFTTNLNDLSVADFIIEAIVESEEVKKSLFVQLDKIAKSSAILASNTSSISITRLASSTTRPQQVIGMHFMNPPPVMKLIEIVRGADTSDATFAATKALSQRCSIIAPSAETTLSSRLREANYLVVNSSFSNILDSEFSALFSSPGL